MPNLIRPIINMNGKKREVHIEERRAILDKLDEALKAMLEIIPHGRDYQHDATGTRYQEDLEIWKKRYATLIIMHSDVQEEAVALIDDGNY